MSVSAALLPELEHELAGTRRVLERVPFERASWRPHPKSWTVSELAAHLSNLPSWIAMTIEADEVDLAGFGETGLNKVPGSQAELLERFDRNAAAAKAALAGASDENLMALWTLRTGDVKHFSLPRLAALRAFVLNHSVHHRGQLTVYLRMLDAPVPALYGPSADEPGM